MITTAEITGSRILVRPTMAETLLIAAIRGAMWDRNAKAFSLRATPANAHVLRHRIAALRTVEALSALETPAPSNPSTPAPAVAQERTSREESAVSTETLIATSAPAPVAAPAPSLAPLPVIQSAPAAPVAESVIQIVSAPAIALPDGLLPHIHPWKHQAAGYRFAMGALRRYHAALLAASMGTGKTLVATMLALGIDARAVVVVCPLRVIGSWRDQLTQYIAERFVSAPLVDKIGTAEKRVTFAKDKLALARALKLRFFVIVNYDVIWRSEMAQFLLGQSWDAVIYDECFPTGTTVATPTGDALLEDLRVGDAVLGYDHERGCVVRTEVRAFFEGATQPTRLVDLGFAKATANHPVWIGDRYTPAGKVLVADRVWRLKTDGSIEMRMVRDLLHEKERTAILQPEVLCAMAGDGLPASETEPECARRDERAHEADATEERLSISSPRVSDFAAQPVSLGRGAQEIDCRTETPGIPDVEWRQWPRAHGTAANAGRHTGMADGSDRANGHFFPQRNRHANALPTRCGESRGPNCSGGGWCITPGKGREGSGFEEGRILAQPGVDSASLYEPTDSGKRRQRAPNDPIRIPVFNIETGTGNYFANRVLVSNCHRLKTVGGRASMFAKRFLPHVNYRILASGTPLAHSQLDIFGQFRAAAPNVFGRTYAAFKTRYAVMGGPSREWVVGYKNQADLEDRMAPLTWRCTKREALPDLPEQIDVEYATELCASAARIYKQLERDMITEIQGHMLTAANCLTKVLRLQQLTGGALKSDDGAEHIVDDGKRKLLADTLEDLGDEPVVIFCRFRSDIDAAHEACVQSLPKHKDAQGNALPVSLELSGSRDELERWQAGEAQALVVQVQSGSVGISLVRANVAIYYSLSSNLVEYDQSRSRLHRPGQKRPCTYIYLTCQGTIDQKILAALRARQDVIESIMRSVAEKAKQKEQ